MSFENPPESILNQEEFWEAFTATQEKYPSLTRRSAETFLTNVAKRNHTSKQKGEDDYFKINVQQALNEYNLHGSDATPYRSIAGRYFGSKSPAIHDFKEEIKLAAEKQLIEETQQAEADRGGDPED